MKIRVNYKEWVAVFLLFFTYSSTYPFYSVFNNRGRASTFLPFFFYFVIIAWGVIRCGIRPKRLKPVYVVGFLMVFLSICYTLFLWIFQSVTFAAFARLISTTLGIFLYVGAAAFLLNLFEDRAVKLFMKATLLAYTWAITLGTFNNGIAELLRYIVHFWNYSGSMQTYMEMHEAAFVLGVLLLYYIFFLPKKTKTDRFEIYLGLFYFLLAFKRIGLCAFAIAALAAMIIQVRLLNLTKKAIRSFSLIVSIFSILYVIFLFSGTFNAIMAQYGINMILGLTATLFPWDNMM